MKRRKQIGTRQATRSIALVALVVAGMLGSFVAPVIPHAAAAGDVGFEDGSFSGTAPTGREPQSKLWFNDGIWWGSLYDSSSRHYDIHRLNWSTQVWADTGTLIDERSGSSADTLWDGSKLYIVTAPSDQSNSSSPPTSGDTSMRVLRYSYSSATQSYALDAGFPVTIANAAVESVSLDKDSTGRIWVTWTYANGTGHRSVFVTHSTVSTASYAAPYVLPFSGATNLDNSDYSAIVAYNGKIGVMWSNQTDATMYFAFHVDGAADSAWTLDNALSGPGWVDNHMAIKSLQADSAGQVFAAAKTSLNGDKCPPSSSNTDQPLILLLWMDGTGSWQRRTFSTAADCESRPIVVLDEQSRMIYLFATLPAPGSSYGSGGAIYYKSTSLDNPNFGSGPGDPFIQLAADQKINNATSTKQTVSPATGLVVLASDNHTHMYTHNAISLGTDTTAPTVTATSPTDGATNVATSTTVSATFSEPMASASLTSSFTLTDTTTSSAVAGSVTYDGPSQTATFTPSAALAAGDSFSATVDTGATDLAGNPLAAPVTWSFTTASSPAPETTITSGPSGLVNSASASFSFTSSISGSTFTCSLDGAPFTACSSPQTYSSLADGSHAFAVAATAGGVTDPTPATASWTVDTTAPTVTATSPTDGATNVATSTTVSATFSEPMASASLTSSFTLTDTTTSSAVAGSVTYDGPSQTATFTPSAALAAGDSFSATVDAGATDLAGNPLAAPVSWSFTTATIASGTLFSDDFELGNLSRWSSVSTSGGGTATVQGSVVSSGAYAARFTEAGSGGSRAYARADLGSDQTELTITGDFRVAGEGASNQNVPLFRLFDAGGSRRLSLYRQDVSGGIYVWDATGYHSTGQSLSLNTWAHVELHVIAGNGSGIATVELRLDGALIYQTTSATLPPVRTVQIGNETSSQPMDLYVDNVAVTQP